jgi:hypothetical protein
MWCGRCRSDVTGTVSGKHNSICCSRCGVPLPGDLPAEKVVAEQVNDSCHAATEMASPDSACDETKPHAPHALREPWLALESWEIDEDLRHMQRLLRGRRYSESALDGEAIRIDAATALLLLGLTTLACGVSLLAWWHFAARPDLCAPALACTIAGQFLLMIGLAVQPERRASKTAVKVPAPTLADHPLLRTELGQLEKEKR